MTISSALFTAVATVLSFVPPCSPAMAAPVSDPVWVDPFLGTTGDGNTFPGATLPFGMVQWSPDTTPRPNGGGYSYGSSTITGFSLTHLSGPGCPVYGDVPILPTVGAVRDPASAGASFAHARESAAPGFYGVTLGNRVRTELSATTRAAIGRFTFPATRRANLLLKLSGSQAGTFASSWRAVSDTEVVGSVTSGRFCGARNRYTVHFALSLDRPFGTGAWRGRVPRPGARSGAASAASGTAPNGAYLTFDTRRKPVVTLRAAISFTSVAGARANLDAEVRDRSFDRVRAAARRAWSEVLGRIRVAGGTVAQRRIFYTALYHALLHPNVFSDVDGTYLGFDRRVHRVAGNRVQYANFAGWDIYRSQAPLIGMLAPRRASDMAQSAVNAYRQSGRLPKWTLANDESYIMAGDPAAPVIASIHAFGGRRFDTATAKAAMIRQATVENDARPGLNHLKTLGYLPSDGAYGCCNFRGSVSTTLEYAIADFAVGAFAGALGDLAARRRFIERAQSWRRLLHPTAGLMWPRTVDGRWTDGFDPAEPGHHLVEGTSWQYTGMVPFNVRGLADAMGGDAAMIAYLDHVLAMIDRGDGGGGGGGGDGDGGGDDGGGGDGDGGGGGGRGDRADLRNQPGLGLPWLYGFVGRPWRTQEIVRAVQNRLWHDSRVRWGAGNDDLGTMSAWYVWSAIGIFPVIPGTAHLALGSPQFTRVVVTLSTGKRLVVQAPRAAPDAPFVQAADWNGGEWNKAYLPPSTVSEGGVLRLDLGKRPDTSWAADRSAAPPSYGGATAGVR